MPNFKRQKQKFGYFIIRECDQLIKLTKDKDHDKTMTTVFVTLINMLISRGFMKWSNWDCYSQRVFYQQSKVFGSYIRKFVTKRLHRFLVHSNLWDIRGFLFTWPGVVIKITLASSPRTCFTRSLSGSYGTTTTHLHLHGQRQCGRTIKTHWKQSWATICSPKKEKNRRLLS